MAQGTPSYYGQSHLDRLKTRYQSAFGQAVQEFSPRYFPGMPPQALLGQTSGTYSMGEDTVWRRPGVLNPGHASFHEIGFFQVPAGTWDVEPAPAGSGNDQWSQYARHSRVVDMLGRQATTAGGAWKTAPRDQAAIGIEMFLEGGKALAAHLGTSATPGSQWFLALAFAAFSAGSAGGAKAFGPFSEGLDAYPENQRFGVLVTRIAEKIRTTPDGSDPSVASGTSRSKGPMQALRTWQKMRAGEALTRATGGDADWFGLGISDAQALEAEKLITDRANGSSSAGEAPPLSVAKPSSVSVLGLTLSGVAALGAGFGLGWLIYGRVESKWFIRKANKALKGR